MKKGKIRIGMAKTGKCVCFSNLCVLHRARGEDGWELVTSSQNHHYDNFYVGEEKGSSYLILKRELIY